MKFRPAKCRSVAHAASLTGSEVVHCCPAVEKNRFSVLDQITAGTADRSLSVDILNEPGHEISLSWRPSAERTAMSPLEQRLHYSIASCTLIEST
jgi:hypothetical protein